MSNHMIVLSIDHFQLLKAEIIKKEKIILPKMKLEKIRKLVLSQIVK